MPGTLYVVATPIGNLEDVTYRAARVLADADLIAAENTRTAGKLLRHLGIKTRPLPYNDRNKSRATGRILGALRRDASVALISDAGTPGVSDPGQDLVVAALREQASVVPVPGPSAATALLSVAGVWGRSVWMLGFLPRRRGDRRRTLAKLAERGEPAVVFESPHRLVATLHDVEDVLPEARLIVGRELTKLYEEIWRGSPGEAVGHFVEPRGEFTMVILPPPARTPAWSDDEVRAALERERRAGRRRPEAAAAVATRSGRPRREVYALWPES